MSAKRLPAPTVTVAASASMTGSNGNPVTSMRVPSVSATLLNEWRVPRALTLPWPATPSTTSSRQVGRSTKEAPYRRVRDQFVSSTRVTLAAPDQRGGN